MPDQEQRIRAPSIASVASGTTTRPPRPPSVASLRHPPPSASTRRHGVHSRRTSVDMDTQSLPGSPITYFPNPSSFAQSAQSILSSHTTRSPSLTTMPLSATVGGSCYNSSDDEGDDKGDRTPRIVDHAIESGGSSPRTRRSSTFGGPSSGDMRRTSTATVTAPVRQATTPRTLSTPIRGYGSTREGAGLGLGLGNPSDHPQRVGRDKTLASPRRISTSQGPSKSGDRLPPATAIPHRSPGSMLNLPATASHEAYYSQPGTTTTPRFKDSSAIADFEARPSQLHTTLPIPGSLGHERHASHSSALNSPAGAPQSPGRTVLRRLRKTASVVGLSVGGRPETYDGDAASLRNEPYEDDLVDEGMKANGTRVWYSSFVTIDWMHDAIKESARVRRLRHNAHRSIRGSIANSWDRFQGWFVVTIIGIVCAILAFLIVRAEMALFDLKEGFCSTSWGTAKRFCCAPRHRNIPGTDPEVCDDWIEWGEFFDPGEQGGREGAWIWGGPEFSAYMAFAICLALLSSAMTIYLSSSAHHTTSKDSTFLRMPVNLADAAPSAPKQSSPRTDERQPLLDSSLSSLEEEPKEVYEPPRKVMYYAAGSGIPEIKTILSGFVIHGYLGGWTLLTKSVGLALSVASGLSLGKEGPLVHISSCVGNIVSRLFLKFECNEAKRREVLSAACAAGVSVAFGAPIGGVLFSLEEVSYYFPPKVMWRSFWCAAVAAITLKGLNPFGNGSLVLFEVTYTKDYHYWEFAIFVLLGVFGGVYGAVFSRLNILWAKNVRQGTWVKNHPIVEVLLVTILTTVLGFLNPYCRMGGTELVASLFAECREDSTSPLCVDHPREIASVVWPIAMALLIKGALTIITFGIKLPAGIFIPSLVVGACFGRIVGLGMEWVEFAYPHLPIFGVCTDTECIVPGIYAMIGAAATLAGVTRTTVSLAVIVLELTGTLNYVVPIMLSVLVAKTVADALERKGIYDLVIDLNQLPYLDSKHEYLWGGRRAAEIAERDVPTIRADKAHTVRSLTGKLLELVRVGMADSGFPVLVKETVDADGRTFSAMRVVGFLGMNELEHALSLLADEPDAALNLMPDDAASRQTHPRSSVMSIFSFAESYSDPRYNPYDISKYIDRAPMTVQTHSPLELVQQLFVKLGARQIIVTDSRGVFRGLVTKKAWLAFLAELEEEGH